MTLVLSTSVSAQTTQPAQATPVGWQDTVRQLADRLIGTDAPALNAALTPPPVIRSFTSDTLQSPDRLLGVTSGAIVIGVHAYSIMPTTLASDLAADFKEAANKIPEAARSQMAILDPSGERRANEIAAQWLTQVLQPARDQAVGVIVLWPEARRLALNGPVRRATFVLVKAQFVNGRYVLVQITVGDPLEPPR
jgi:hypothetical protein